MGNQSSLQLQGTFSISETSTDAEVSQNNTDTPRDQWTLVPPAQSFPLGQAAPAASPKGKGKSKGPITPPPMAAKAPPPAPPTAAKAKGKGGPPPPPPAAAKAKGKGGAPASAKAKGKGAPPPPKAKGKGKSAPSGKGKGVPVPAHLQAPGPQRMQFLRPYVDGSIWESLQPWQADSPAVLQGLQINFDALLDQWRVAPVQPVVLAQDDVFFGFRSQFHQLQIISRSLRLTPDLVRRGLCEDLDVLSLEQAEALCWMKDLLGEVRGFLHAHVQRVGAAELEPSMALMLAVDSVPMWAQLATFAKTRHTHADTMAFCLEPCADLQNLVEKLGSSRPLRTVLQACLVATNVMSQSGQSRLTPEDLQRLRGRKIFSNGTSVLTLVARDLQATHERRCRLRFLRMLAVGKAPVVAQLKKLVWVYLDDMQESPWDAVGLLKSCNVPVCNSQLLVEKQEMAQVLGSIQRYQRLANPGSIHLGDRYSQPLVVNQQLRDLASSLQQGMDELDGCQERLTTSANSIVGLFGRSANARVTLFEAATDSLQCLYQFGTYLEVEMHALASAQKRGLGRTGQWGHWQTVETDHIVLQTTRDLDLVRQMRNPSQDQPEAVPFARAAPDAVADQGPEMQHVHLLHGGPDGEYHRCEATGKWVPVGYAAAVAERDRGDRGATAGFFVTF